MASQEQVQQFLNDSSTSTSGSSSDVDDDDDDMLSSSDEPQEQQHTPSLSSVPAKMRIKLSLKLSKSQDKDEDDDQVKPQDTAVVTAKTSTVKQDQDKKPINHDQNQDEDEEEIVKATVVNSSDDANDNDDEDAEACPIESTSPVPTTATQKKKSFAPRAVRLPPMSSPGLLIPPSAGVYRGEADINGFTTPSSVFDYCMSLAGYTTEARTTNPHRGSSVKRVVGDMFDSNVNFTLHFPPLVPKEVWNLPKKEKDKGGDEEEEEPTMEEEEDNPRDAAQVLLRALAPLPKENGDTTESTVETSSKASRKRRRPLEFCDMAPLSLTLPYPESFLQKRLKYVEQVKEREKAIVASQEAAEQAQDAKERYEEVVANTKRGTEPPPPPPVPEPIVIPPIPEPPTPPRLSELEHFDLDGLMDESQHPIYIPNATKEFTSHLDQSSFHITDGRYFGLVTNGIADPHFVGPNAPGISGLNMSGATGLATSYAGSSTSNGVSASALNAAYYGSVGGGSSSAAATSKSAGSVKTFSKKAAAAAAVSNGTEEDHDEDGPIPTSSAGDLKKIMDEGGDLAEEMKGCIMRAAVIASRNGKHGQSFAGPNGETYPDISKAFAAHAGLRPCQRCKNNKQGAYHCRLRRRHRDLDYDGGNSPAILAPLFEEPLEHMVGK